ncbi:transcriptional regulator [Tistrella bauzanensis]|uniref:Transcriptional regulator n=1 Tax=Tistrella bauzanensis TaxID=657419 RepID=A0ABQ1IEF8_9PROT|nr:helix-turn-helix domain-containing protein [Tistrella bauzanensis]GGB36270.1 transcriptional regulator [Tistrella bauzanensis]
MSRDVVKSAARVIHVLEYFDDVRRAATVSEIAEHHDWPLSSTSVLMRSLVTLGYLDYEPATRTYMPTTRVALLGNWIQANLFKDGQLMHLMEWVSEQTGETVVVAARNGLGAQYIQVLQATNPMRMVVRLGTVRPLCWSGSGWMLLSTMDDDTVRKLAQRHNADVAPGNSAIPGRRIDIPRLIEVIADVRARGYAFSANQVTANGGLIAMLLPTAPGDKPLVIGLAGLTTVLEANLDRYVAVMRDGIARHIG